MFQEAVEGDSSAAAAYDAIVVEQWTIIDVSYTQTRVDFLFYKLLLKYFHYCNYLHKLLKSIQLGKTEKKKTFCKRSTNCTKKPLERPV